MKIRLALIIVFFIGVHSASACTDPADKKAARHTNENCLIYEYYQPARVTLEKQKPQRPIAVVADSILSAAKENFENNSVSTEKGLHTKESIAINAETDMKYYRYKADAITLRTRNWADSICRLFRRPSFIVEPDDLPR